jgi:pre-mRNA-processing factor 6
MSPVGPKTANTYNIPPPSHYIAGAGRGAQGFTTRSDIGPATVSSTFQEPNFGQAPVGYIAGRGRGMGELARDQGELSSRQITQENERDRSDYSESNYDEFAGYSERLFSRGLPYEEDDLEADRIYEAIDERMEGRRKRSREIQLLTNMKKNRIERPTIADQFADLKRDLATVTAEQWDQIPEIGDYSLKLKQRKRAEVFTPVPDYLLHSAASRVGTNNLSNTVVGGYETPANGMSSTIAGMGMAEARGTVLSLKLDKMSDSVTGQTVVDPKGYLTDLNSLHITSDAEIGDIQKARTLLSSVTSTNPKHGPGWIAAARVEEFAGKLVQARKIIKQGYEACPDSEDVWLEAARLNTVENARTILATAVRHLPNSVKIWLKAADLEVGETQKKIVLRRALEFIPNSVKLWKTAIELEGVEDARIMLSRAVECVPHSVDMWLALARLETYENARRVLNNAREAIPTEPSIWITAAKLEEAHGATGETINRIIEKALTSLSQYQVVIDREKWLKEAEAVEASGSPLTCAAIVRHTIHLGLEEEDWRQTWLDDADACLNRPAGSISVETARAIYKRCIEVYPNKKSVWLAAAMLEKQHGTSEKLDSMLLEAVKHCPHAEILWLMAAKEKWINGDIGSARAILVEAFDVNSNSEQIWLAAVKLEWETKEISRARMLLSKARDRASTERVWLKSALLEREVGAIPEELTLLDEAINRYPTFHKYYLMAGQACDEVLHDTDRAREYYQKGMKNCPDNALLHILLARLLEKSQGVSKGRSILELAKLKFSKNEHLWLESIRLERRHGNDRLAENLMARALQECPTSGILWAEEILTCPKPQQKSKSVEAHKRCDNNPHVILAIGRLFDRDRKILKARKWYSRAVTLDPDFGDAWAYYYAFELKNQTLSPPGMTCSEKTPTEGSPEDILNKCVTAEPHHGELWTSISKQTEYRHDSIGIILKRVAEKLLSTNRTHYERGAEDPSQTMAPDSP